MEFHKVAVLGGGLLGGSLALRLQGEIEVSLWARRDESVSEAKSMGLESATSDLRHALQGADLVVLSVPVGVMPGLLEAALKAGLSHDAVVTDVGSVKAGVHRSLESLCSEHRIKFIGGHPMAGSESKGIRAARKDLFQGSACLLTDGFNVGEPFCGLLEAFWSSIGCRVSWMDAKAHDELVARISHFPHVMAAATALVSYKSPEDACFGGGGLRDTTRVAGGDPSMWTEILLENAGAVSESIRAARESLGEMLAMMEKGDHEALLQWLTQARNMQQAGKAKRDNEFES